MQQIQRPERSPQEQEVFDLRVQKYFLEHHPEQVYEFGSTDEINAKGAVLNARLQELEPATNAEILRFPLKDVITVDDSEIAG